MFSVGDALLVGIVLLFGVWALKRIYPEKFASEFGRLVRRARMEQEAHDSGRLIVKAVALALAEHEKRQAKAREAVVPIKRDDGKDPNAPFDIKVAVPAQDPLTGREDAAGFSSRAESNVGRAHVAEDGAFAGGLIKEGAA